jgi:hypothetical protein
MKIQMKFNTNNSIGLRIQRTIKLGMTNRALVLFVLLGAAAPAFAKPPPDSDGSLAPWYQSLAQPYTGYPCCSVADCRTAKYRAVADHFDAFIDRRTFGPDAPDAWVPVPPSNVLHRHDNPTGEAVVCWYNGEIRCFVEGSGI